MTGSIDPLEICPRCHSDGREPALGRTLRERIRDLF